VGGCDRGKEKELAKGREFVESLTAPLLAKRS